MSAWLLDTLVYTGALIAAVLILRRPVSRWFGPQTAYSLWALPFLRLLLPPITLPAWMAPQTIIVPVQQPAVETVAFVPTSDFVPEDIGLSPAMADLPWAQIAISIWIGVALAFLLWRAWSYAGMKRALLANARPVGETGSVRLVETPAVSSPVAFGVRDKVIALPVDFMAMEDLRARDLVIAHELAHHRAHDLLANIAAQPLLALHWFNPIAWLGWRAMRRDQEAACDARVVAGRELSERATYGRIIASFAAGQNLALAAPMACPVLGEKSIIHRLRSLTMTEISPRRRIAGRLLTAGALLAVPLTASVSYAETMAAAEMREPPQPPAPPVAPLPAAGVPDAPVAPFAPAAPPVVDVPQPPAPPSPPMPGRFETERDWQTSDGKNDHTVHRFSYASTGGQDEKEFNAAMKQLEANMKAHQVNEKAIAVAMKEVERAQARAEAQRKVAESTHDRAMAAQRRIDVKVIESFEDHVKIDGETVDCGSGETTIERVTDSGKHIIVICKKQIRKQALLGLKEAREEIAREHEMPKDVRKLILQQIDQQIALHRAS